jgi:uncharacterized protein (DUF1499 family)
VILRLVLGAFAVAALAGMAWVRLAPTDPARWHVDPLAVADPATPNFARLSLDLAAPPAEAATRVEAAMLALPRTERIAGSAAEGWMTFRTRSRLMGYPDFTSIRILPEGEGARVVAFARSRFGYSDLGVNAARLEALRAALEA